MFVLMYESQYEGQTVLGVYSSIERATVAMQHYTSDGLSVFYEDIVIRQYSVDTEADLDAGETVGYYEQAAA